MQKYQLIICMEIFGVWCIDLSAQNNKDVNKAHKCVSCPKIGHLGTYMIDLCKDWINYKLIDISCETVENHTL